MHKLTAQEMNRLTVEQFHEAKKVPLTVVLDNVRSQHNIGSVFRTADAFLIERVMLCGCCCCPPNQEIHKTALGAELTVDWQYYSNTLEAINALKAEGYTIFAIEQVENSKTIEEINFQAGKKYAVVFGHEVFGVQQEVVDAADECIEIPQFGTKHSLNVSVTAGIVLYQISKILRNIQ